MVCQNFRLTEESMRWLEMQGQHNRVIDVLKKIAASNKKSLTESHLKTEIEVLSCNRIINANLIKTISQFQNVMHYCCNIVYLYIKWVAIRVNR